MSDEPQKPIGKETPAEPADKTEEYLNNWKRERADFLNYKKDEARRIEEFVRFANEDLALEMMEVLDTLEIARNNFPGKKDDKAIKDWMAGLDSVMKQSHELFKKYNIEKIKVEGETFNPELHEVVEMEPDGEKMIQVRAGYTMYGKVVRPARVKIIK